MKNLSAILLFTTTILAFACHESPSDAVEEAPPLEPRNGPTMSSNVVSGILAKCGDVEMQVVMTKYIQGAESQLVQLRASAGVPNAVGDCLRVKIVAAGGEYTEDILDGDNTGGTTG